MCSSKGNGEFASLVEHTHQLLASEQRCKNMRQPYDLNVAEAEAIEKLLCPRDIHVQGQHPSDSPDSDLYSCGTAKMRACSETLEGESRPILSMLVLRSRGCHELHNKPVCD